MKSESLDDQWKQWDAASDAYLGKVENKPSQDHKGKGEPISFVQTESQRLRTTMRAPPSLLR
eukprot:8747393-Heterocapsa_arctica.AAC.1